MSYARDRRQSDEGYGPAVRKRTGSNHIAGRMLIIFVVI